MAEAPFRHKDADASPGFVLWKLTSLWQAQVTAALQSFGLTQTQYAILASLRWLEEHGQRPTQRELTEHAKLDKMTLSKAVRRLEEAGLVNRIASPSDARATQVALTQQGRRSVQDAVVAVEDVDAGFFSALDATGLGTWLRLTRTVVEHHSAEPT